MTETTAEKLTRLILLADHPDQSPCDAIRFDQECGAAWRAGRLIALDTPTCGEPARIWANMDPTIDKGVFTEGVWYAEPGMLLHSPEYIAASALRGAMAEAEARGRDAGLEEAAAAILEGPSPCRPAYPAAWSDEAIECCESGQIDAASSWAFLIRTMIGKGDGNG